MAFLMRILPGHFELLLLVGTVSAISMGCQALLADASVRSDGESASLCDDYCKTVSETCEGPNLQYGSSLQCTNVCRVLAPGNKDDESGNTLGCRLHYALEASEDPETFCLAAGPGGNGVCGSNCESFCQIGDEVCTEENSQYNTITECMAACALFDHSVPYNGEVLDGDSFACRLTHLTLAAGSPDVHCSHIAVVSAFCF